MIERLTRIAQRPVSRETFEKLEAYVALLREESSRQNLISRTTLDNVWDRHILNSGQLVAYNLGQERPGLMSDPARACPG